MHHHIILRVLSKLLIPLIMLYALYVQFHGDFGPGGGFQAGVIMASAFILHGLLFGLDETEKVVPPWLVQVGIALGVRIPFAYTDDQHTVAIELLHGETRMIGFEAKLATGRPPGMAGMDMLVPMAFNIPIAIPDEGRVALKAVIDGSHGRRHDIKVIKRPQQQQQTPPIQPA